MNNPVPGGRSGGRTQMNSPPQMPGGRSGGRSVLSPTNNPPPTNPPPIGRSGGRSVQSPTTNPPPTGRSGGRSTQTPTTNPPPTGRSGGRSTQTGENPTPGGRSGGRSTQTGENPTPGGRSGGFTLRSNGGDSPNPTPTPGGRSGGKSVQTNNPTPGGGSNTPTRPPPKKMVMPELNIPVKENKPQTQGSSVVNPTLLVVAQDNVKGKSLGPLSNVKESSSNQGGVSGKGPKKLVIKPPLNRTAKPWSMPFKLPQIEANTEYIQPTAPLEQQPKVTREPQRKIKGDAWTKIKGPLLLYNKIKKSLLLETCNKKEKRFMAIYYNWILFWGSSGNRPEENDQMPVSYFDLDNVLDSTEIKINEKKNELTLPLLPNMGAKNVKYSFDQIEDLRNWWKETKKIVAVLERTERSDMSTEEMVKLKLAEINMIFPEKNFNPMGSKGEVEWTKAG